MEDYISRNRVYAVAYEYGWNGLDYPATDWAGTPGMVCSVCGATA